MAHDPDYLETERGGLTGHTKLRMPTTFELKSANLKNIAIIVAFLMGIAGLYNDFNARLVKLEAKHVSMADQLLEMKTDTTRLINKLDETTRSLQTQIRDVEQFVVLPK